MKNDEHICEVCQKLFIVEFKEAWAYKIAPKGGKTHWYCRYNCMRTGEKKLEKPKETRGRKKGMKKIDKPEREELAEHLRRGLSWVDIGKQYGVGRTTVFNWLKSYDIGGGDIGKPKEDIASAKPIHIFRPPTGEKEMCVPTPAEVERFFTDGEQKELPRVEMDQVNPITQAPTETIDDSWKALQTVLFKLEAVYIDDALTDARKSFCERLKCEMADWVGEK